MTGLNPGEATGTKPNNLAVPPVNTFTLVALPKVHQPIPLTLTKKELRIIAAVKPGDEKDLVLCFLHLLGRIDEILRLRRFVTLWTRKRKDGTCESTPMPMDDVDFTLIL